MRVRIVFISDTHGFHRKVKIPDGDILVHAGDLTMIGKLEELDDFNDYLGGLPHSHKIVIAGNHDFCFETYPKESVACLKNAVYLQDEAVTVCGIKFYGTPWQPWLGGWAFNLLRGPALRKKWDLIPEDTDILITHGPPKGCGDLTIFKERVGCEDLLAAVRRVRPRLHIFGHIHEAWGSGTREGTTFINASTSDRTFAPVNPPAVYAYETQNTRAMTG